MRRRLFWMQLVLLTCVDLVFSVYRVSFQSLWVANVIPHTSTACDTLWKGTISLGLMSCIVEVHIAVGFMAACMQSSLLSRILWRAMPLNVPMAAGLFFFIEPTMDYPTPQNDCTYSSLHREVRWASTVLSLVTISILAYAVSAAKTANLPKVMRRRALLRGFTYIISFMLTFGFRAALSLLSCEGILENVLLDKVSTIMLTLNGALNVMTYISWMYHTKRLSANVAARADICSREQLIIDQYFDLQVGVDETIHDAQRQTA